MLMKTFLPAWSAVLTTNLRIIRAVYAAVSSVADETAEILGIHSKRRTLFQE